MIFLLLMVVVLLWVRLRAPERFRAAVWVGAIGAGIAECMPHWGVVGWLLQALVIGATVLGLILIGCIGVRPATSVFRAD